MAYNTRPTPQYVHEFARERKDFWAAQVTLDTLMVDLYMKRNYMDVAVGGDEPPQNAPPLMRLTTGLAGLAVDQDFALVNSFPYIHINSPTPELQDRDKADNVMEPFFNEALIRSQHGGKVLPRSIFDLRLLGRGCFDLYPLLQAWGTEEYKRFVKEWGDLVAGGADENAIKDAAALVQAYRRDNFPLRWRYLPATNIFPVMSSERRIPECVQIYEMSLSAIEAEYGEGALPDSYDRETVHSSRQLVPVYVYSNWFYQLVVVGDEDAPRAARPLYEHKLGMNPVVIMEAELFTANTLDIRWKSAIYHVRDMCEAVDSVVNQLNTNFRTYTLSPLTITIDPELRPDAVTAGRNYEIPVAPGGEYILFKGEVLGRMPLPEINKEAIELQRLLIDIIKMAVDRPIQRGQGLSGQSAAMYDAAARMSVAEFDPAVEAIKDAMEEWYRLACRCLRAISEDEKTDDDPTPKVWITLGNKRGSVGLSGRDVIGWEHSSSAIVSSKVPFDENARVDVAQKWIGMGIDPVFAYERWGQMENPLQRFREGIKFQILQSLADYFKQAVQQRAGAIMQKLSPQELDQLGLRMQGLPPAVQQGLGEQPEIPGNVRQGMANEGRTGIPEMITGGPFA